MLREIIQIWSLVVREGQRSVVRTGMLREILQIWSLVVREGQRHVVRTGILREILQILSLVVREGQRNVVRTGMLREIFGSKRRKMNVERTTLLRSFLTCSLCRLLSAQANKYRSDGCNM
jgi:hypothetical protein